MVEAYVRVARADEAGEIARVQMTTWRVAYRRLIPAPVLDGLDQEWMARQWRTAIDAPPSPYHRVLVALEGGALVGFAASGPADPPAAAPDEPPLAAGTAAVTDLLVEPRWGRRGHGSRLLAASVDHWREDGFTAAVAWAFEADVATRTFLTSANWELDGAVRALDIGDLLVPQVRLHTGLVAE